MLPLQGASRGAPVPLRPSLRGSLPQRAPRPGGTRARRPTWASRAPWGSRSPHRTARVRTARVGSAPCARALHPLVRHVRRRFRCEIAAAAVDAWRRRTRARATSPESAAPRGERAARRAPRIGLHPSAREAAMNSERQQDESGSGFDEPPRRPGRGEGPDDADEDANAEEVSAPSEHEAFIEEAATPEVADALRGVDPSLLEAKRAIEEFLVQADGQTARARSVEAFQGTGNIVGVGIGLGLPDDTSGGV